MAAPHYVAGIDFNPAVRQDAYDVMARLIEHYRAKSTDRVPEQWREPVRNYRDQDLWRQEMQNTKHNVGAEISRYREETNQHFERFDRRSAPP